MDVNNFKLINDRCGHAAGDAALRDIANAVRSCIRKTDILIRYGGDEFLLLFPRMTEEAFSTRKSRSSRPCAASACRSSRIFSFRSASAASAACIRSQRLFARRII